MTDHPAATITFINPPELAVPPGYAHVAEVRASRLVYVAGQVALDRDGKLVGKGDIEAQAEQVFRNIGAALAACGCSPRNLVKFTVFMRDVGGLAAYRKARDRFLGDAPKPASSLIEVSRLVSDDFLIEVEAVAAA